MKKISFGIGFGLILTLIFAVFAEYSDQKNYSIEVQNNIEAKKKKRKGRLYSEASNASLAAPNSIKQLAEEKARLANPQTGEIPNNIRQKELAFAKTLPKSSAAVEFSHRGPFNVGGRTRAFGVDVDNSQHLIAGGVSGGIWKSTDGGESWQKKTSGEQLSSVTCIQQDIRDGKTNVWYAGTGEGYGNSASATGAYFLGNGMLKSTDNGESWQPIASTQSASTVSFTSNWNIMWNVAVDYTIDSLDVVYGSTYGNVYRSTDGGDSWEELFSNLGGSPYTTNVLVANNGLTYIFLNSDANAASRGVYLSEDHGETWENISAVDFPDNMERCVMDFNPQDPTEVYFFMNTPDFGKHTNTFFDGEDWNSLWKLSNTFQDTTWVQDWTDLSDNLPDEGTGFATLYTQSGYDMVVKVHPDSTSTVFMGGTNLYRSTDGFTSDDNTTFIGGYEKTSIDTNWTIYDNHHPDQHSLWFDGNVMYSINDGGIFKSTNTFADDVLWESLNKGYFTTQLYALGINQKQSTPTIVGGFQDNGNFVTRDADPTADWVLPFNGDGSFSFVTEDENTFYLSIQRGRVAKFTLDADGNAVSYRRIEPAGANADDGLFIHPFVVDPNQEDVMFYPNGHKLFRHSNLSSIVENGNQQALSTGWESFSDGIDLSSAHKIVSIHATNANPAHRLYVGTTHRNTYRVDSIFSSNPLITKMNYRDINDNLGVFHGYTASISSNPDNGDEVMAALSNYGTRSLSYSNDGGEHFENISGNLEENPNGSGNGPSCRSVSILPFDNGEILYLVGTSVGLFGTSELNGLNTVWSNISPDLIGNVVIEQVITRKTDGLVLVATHGNGIYSANITSVDDLLSVDEQDIAEQKNPFELTQNPSSGPLEFVSTYEGNVELSLIELSTGRLIKKSHIEVQLGQNQIELMLKTGEYIIEFQSEKVYSRSKIWIR
ncbi:MAG: hypothetical protein ACPG4W_00620 [Flavobacteriales bacterium]